ncbi:MAG: hypothetical protein ACP5UC_03390 [Candidatus Micrarchaeia archaeon]
MYPSKVAPLGLANSSLVSFAGNINVKKASAAKTFGPLFFFLFLFFVALKLNSPFIGVISAIGLGIYLIYLGYTALSKYLLISNTPISKAESAPIGFNIFNAKFTPEDGKVLVSPLTKTPCVFYTVVLTRSIRIGNTSQMQVVSFISRGTKSTLYDGTGHIVLDLDSLRTVRGKSSYISLTPKFLEKSVNGIPEEILPIKEAIEKALQTGTDPDFSSALSNVRSARKQLGASLPPNAVGNWALIEYCISSEDEYTVAGFFDHTTAQLNGKPVGKLSQDPATKFFMIEPGNQKQVNKSALTIAEISFILGIAILLLAYAIGSYHNLYQCLIMSDNYSCIVRV